MRYIYYVIAVMLSVACTDLQIEDGELDYDIIIDGYMTNATALVKVKISQPVAIGEESSFHNIQDAKVSLLGNGQSYNLTFTEGDNNWTDDYYISDDSIQAQEGKTYTLKVEWKGKTYTATDTMPTPPNDTYNLPFFNTSFTSSLMCNQHNFGFETTNFWAYGWGISKDLHIFENSTVAYTHKGSIPQGTFALVSSSSGSSSGSSGPDSMYLYKAELSPEYQMHLRDKLNVSDWQGTIFSTQPANVRTNCSDGALGYFATMNVSYKLIAIEDLNIIEE